ncbi:hypothetical protein IAU60_004726 [Kwoniella sp. DSM 27419]
MRSTAAAAWVASVILASPALAFRNTSPFLLWNTDPSKAFEDAAKTISSSGLVAAEQVYGQMTSLGCEWQNVVIMHVDGLHHSRLSAVNHPTHDAYLHIPYLSQPHRRGLEDGLQAWATECGATITTSFEGRQRGTGKNIIVLDDVQADHIPAVPSDLAEPYILVLTGSGSTSASPEKRQERPFPTHISQTATTTATATATATATETSRPERNSTIPPSDAPLLQRVQILTTPIIVALLITFGLFIPIAGFGVMMLTSIQVPPRMMEIGKGLVVGKDRKDQ